MSQMPRWYRKQLYEHRLGLDSPNAGYMDRDDAVARRRAVQQKLDKDDRDHAKHLENRTNSYLSQLTNPLTQRKDDI